MHDWATISSLATAGGTLVLAVATFSSVRSANRAARSAERALQVGLRPVLFASRGQDPHQKIRWGDNHWASLGGGRAILQSTDGVVYLAIEGREPLTIDLLYGDHEGGQRTISRFSVTQLPGDDSDWVCSVVRHWNLDRRDPR